MLDLSNKWIQITLIILGILFGMSSIKLLVDIVTSGMYESPVLLKGTKSGSTLFRVSKNKIPMSENREHGMEMTYSWWMSVSDTDFDQNGNNVKTVFRKGAGGSTTEFAPKVSLIRGLPISGSNGDGTVDIQVQFNVLTSSTSNNAKYLVQEIPLNTMIHCCLVQKGRVSNFYINGILKKSHEFPTLPTLNTGDLYISEIGGFSGLISTFRYYAYAIDEWKVEQLYAKGPIQQVLDNAISVPANIADEWYIRTE